MTHPAARSLCDSWATCVILGPTKTYDDDDDNDVQWFNVHLKSWLEASLA